MRAVGVQSNRCDTHGSSWRTFPPAQALEGPHCRVTATRSEEAHLPSAGFPLAANLKGDDPRGGPEALTPSSRLHQEVQCPHVQLLRCP